MTEAQPNCVFDDPYKIEHRLLNINTFMFSILSDPAMGPGHALIIPRRHVLPTDVVEEKEARAMEFEKRRLRNAMVERLGAHGVDVFEKYRPTVLQGYNGTKMDHTHIHVLPVWEDDAFYDHGFVWKDTFSALSDENLKWGMDHLKEYE